MKRDSQGLTEEQRKRLFIATAALALIAIAASATLFLASTSEPAVGVIELEGTNGESDAEAVRAMANHTLQSDEIEAVVLIVNSPGGGVTATEEIHGNLERIGEEKPVVTSVEGLAASGGYYASVASDHVVAQPSSYIGNVGVITFLPDTPRPSEKQLETGPYKKQGIPVRDAPKSMEVILNNFVGAVEEGRGSDLNLTVEELTKGSMYLAPEAQRKGLIDETGSSPKAFEKAAELAGLTDYRVVNLNHQVRTKTGGEAHSSARANQTPGTDWSTLTPGEVRRMNPSTDFYYVYMPGRGPKSFDPFQNQTIEETESEGPIPELGNEPPEKVVLVDQAHENDHEPDELHPLTTRLSSKGFSVRTYSGGDLEPKLEKADSLAIINPQTGFTSKEINAVKNFVHDGGNLLLVNDPARTSTTAINPVATAVDLAFEQGYLYNQKNNHGIYRNVYVNQFYGKLQDADRLMLPTAAHVETRTGDIAYTSPGTIHSTTHEEGRYTPIVRTEGVMAMGDWSSMTNPWITAENNTALVDAAADSLAQNR